MHSNDVELVRVYTREPGGVISDETIPHDPAGTTVDIAIECEAGAAITSLNPPYKLLVYVRDLMEHQEIDWTNEATPLTGSLGDANWPSLAVTHVIQAKSTNFNKGHVYNVLAVLTVGTEIASFAESPMFIIT
jgi:hypothetical protein